MCSSCIAMDESTGNIDVIVTCCYCQCRHGLWKLQADWCPPLAYSGVKYIDAAQKCLDICPPSCHNYQGAISGNTRSDSFVWHCWYVFLPVMPCPCTDKVGYCARCCLFSTYEHKLVVNGNSFTVELRSRRKIAPNFPVDIVDLYQQT